MKKLWKVLLRPYEVFVELKPSPDPVRPLTVVLCFLVVGSVANELATGHDAVQREGERSVDIRSSTSSISYSVDERIDVQDAGDTAMNSPLVVVFMIVTTAFAVGILYFLGLLVVAIYLSFIAKSFGTDIGFARWFAFSCWVSIPLIFTSLGWLGEAFFSVETRDSIRLLAPLTWFDQSLAGYAQAIRIDTLWISLIAIFGFHSWTQKTIGFAATVILVPAVLFTIVSTEILKLI